MGLGVAVGGMVGLGFAVGIAVTRGGAVGVEVAGATKAAACCGVGVGDTEVVPLLNAATAILKNKRSTIMVPHPRLTCIFRLRVLYHCHALLLFVR